MWYWIVAAAVFAAALTAWAVMLFIEQDDDEFVLWLAGVVVCGIYAAAWIGTVPLTALALLCVGGGHLIYKKWFKEKK